MRKFFQDQDKIFKTTRDLSGDQIIVVDKSDEFENYLKDGMPTQTKKATSEGKADPIDDLMQNLQNNVANCEKLLASGQVKDFNRKESLLLMIN